MADDSVKYAFCSFALLRLVLGNLLKLNSYYWVLPPSPDLTRLGFLVTYKPTDASAAKHTNLWKCHCSKYYWLCPFFKILIKIVSIFSFPGFYLQLKLQWGYPDLSGLNPIAPSWSFSDELSLPFFRNFYLVHNLKFATVRFSSPCLCFYNSPEWDWLPW